MSSRGWGWMVLAVIGVFLGGTAVATAVAPGGDFDGTARPGGHEWYSDSGEVSFCGRCHRQVAADLMAGPHGWIELSACAFCHPADFDTADGHAAQAALCSDCHGYTSPGEPHAVPGIDCFTCHNVHGPLYGAQVLQLRNDAHAGMAIDLGETDDTAVSKTCIACHTHTEIVVAVVPAEALQLDMGG